MIIFKSLLANAFWGVRRAAFGVFLAIGLSLPAGKAAEPPEAAFTPRAWDLARTHRLALDPGAGALIPDFAAWPVHAIPPDDGARHPLSPDRLPAPAAVSSLDAQRAVHALWLQTRMSGLPAPERAAPDEIDVCLEIAGGLAADAGLDEERERWIGLAWAYWKRREGGDEKETRFADWLAERLPEAWRRARVDFLALKAAASDHPPAEIRRRLLEIDANPEAEAFRDQLLATLGALSIRHDYPDAEALLRRVLDEYPASPSASQARMLLAWAAMVDGRSAEAMERLKELLALHPADPLIPRARGMLAGLEAREARAAPAPAPEPPVASPPPARTPPARSEPDDVF